MAIPASVLSAMVLASWAAEACCLLMFPRLMRTRPVSAKKPARSELLAAACHWLKALSVPSWQHSTHFSQHSTHLSRHSTAHTCHSTAQHSIAQHSSTAHTCHSAAQQNAAHPCHSTAQHILVQHDTADTCHSTAQLNFQHTENV